jgi:putative tricarboxylic transport membrane protein
MRSQRTSGTVEWRTALIRAERITSVLFLLFGLVLFFESRRYPLGTIDNPGPAFLPLLLGAAVVVLSVGLIVRVWKKGNPRSLLPFWPEKTGMTRVSLAFVVILLFTALLEITGHMVNIFLLFLVLLRPIGRQKWTWSISISVGAALVSYFLFEKWLMIPLPNGIWFGQWSPVGLSPTG